MPNPVRYQVTGALLPGDHLYIHRGADDALLEALADDEFCYVLAPRQIGKSSLLARTVDILRGPDKAVRVATANVQAGADIRSEKEWYEGVIRQLAETAVYNPGFVMPFVWEEWWERQIGPHPQRFVAFLREAFLDGSPERWVVAIDEIDATLNLPFSGSFFAAVRLCHDNRPGQPVFRRLSFVLLGTATPHELIADRTRTPFNIGRRIEMMDFSPAEAAQLAAGLPLSQPMKEQALDRIFYWTDGQPYLTQTLCDKLQREWIRQPPPADADTIAQAVDRMVDEEFISIGQLSRSTHFGYIDEQRVKKFPQRTALLKTYRLALQPAGVEDVSHSEIVAELKISGLVKTKAKGRLRVRNLIYERLFDERWVRASMPPKWPRVAAIVLVAAVLGVAANYFLVTLPDNLTDEINSATNDLPTEAHATLASIPGSRAKADELLAQFWDRRALRSELSEPFDFVLPYRLKALATFPTDVRWREATMIGEARWKSLRATFRHAYPVNAIAFGPSGDVILTASDDGTARLWDAKTGNPLGQPLRHQAIVWAVAFSPDGNSVLTGSADTTARLWDAKTGMPLSQPLQHQGIVWAVAFSPDGNSVLTGSDDHTAQLWDAKTGKPMGRPLIHQDWVKAVAFSPDGNSVLTGSFDKTARLWDAHTGQPLGEPLIHPSIVRAVAFSPDGNSVLTRSDATARLWDSHTGQQLGEPLTHQDVVRAIAFSPDGNSVLTGSDDKTARLWDAKTGKQRGEPLTHHDSVVAIAFSPDGNSVLTGSADNTARIWDARTHQLLGEPLVHHDSVLAVAFSPDGGSVLTGSADTTARLWNVRTSHPLDQLLSLRGTVVTVTFSPDGNSVLTGSTDKTAQLRDAKTGEQRGEPLTHQDSVLAVAFSRDGNFVLTGSADHTAQLWDVQTGKPLGELLAHQDSVLAVALSPDGNSALTGSADKTALLWGAKTGKQRGEPLVHQDSVLAVTFSPDSMSVLTGSADKTARLWNAKSGEAIGQLLPHQARVLAVAFSPNGKSVITGSADKTARLWNAKTGQAIGQPLVHEASVRAVVFSDEHTFFTTTDDGRIHQFRIAGSEIRHVSTRWCYGKSLTSPFLDPSGSQARIWDFVTGNHVVIREIRFDVPDGEPIEGDPAELLQMWLDRTALKFAEDGVTLVPKYPIPTIPKEREPRPVGIERPPEAIR